MGGYSIRLDGDHLGRIRFGHLHPLWELEDATHLNVATASAMSRTWLGNSRSRLGAGGFEVVRDLRMGAVQYAAFGASPIDVHGDFHSCLETALGAPTRHWQQRLDGIGVPGWHLPAPGISRGLARLERSSLRFHEAAIAPYWRAATAEAERAVAEWTGVMARDGVGAMLARLHPEITWHAPDLLVDTADSSAICPPGCVHLSQDQSPERRGPARIAARPSSAGLLILPTVFGQTCMIQGKPSAVELVSVPIPVRPQVFDLASRRASHAEQLLGAARAWILDACTDNELSTSGLAQTVGVSISSASEHAAILRRSGLLTSRRQGQAVLHHATALGRQLLQAEDESEDLPRRQFLACRRSSFPAGSRL